MLNFIIFEKDENKRKVYNRVIKKFLYDTCEAYRIYEFEVFNTETRKKVQSLDGIKIFLINVDYANYEGLKFARNIRSHDDFISPIILLTSQDEMKIIKKINKILFIDLIKIDNQLVKKLMFNLKEAYKIATRHSVYTFSIFDEVYRLPYNDINYIEKNINDDSLTIFTKDDSYLQYASIKTIEKILKNDMRFYKSHRSCIINLYNVATYDKKNNIIIFKNGAKTNLIAKNKKTELAERLKEFNNENYQI